MALLLRLEPGFRQELLMLHVPVHRHQRIELAFRRSEQLAVLHSAPPTLGNGRDLEILVERSLQTAVYVFIQQYAHHPLTEPSSARSARKPQPAPGSHSETRRESRPGYHPL